jgi:hypothetical protein
MKRRDQYVLIGAFTAFSWLAMQVLHEGGHVLGALISDGQVQKVVLHPFALSRTNIQPNPNPLLVVWAGPAFGTVFPLAVYLLARGFRWPGLYLYRFLAGFCLVVNGVYILAASFRGLADAGVMLAHGSSRWHLMLFGVVAVSSGLALWNGLGPKFGFGEAKGEVSRQAVHAAVVLFVILAGTEFLLGTK